MQSVYRFQALGVNRRLSVVKGKFFFKKFCVKNVLAKKRKKKEARSLV